MEERTMIDIYAMQRANGDWFGLSDHGRLRVPVFHSDSEAMVARRHNPGMLLFKPAILDGRALHDLAPTDDSAPGFWLVSNPSINLRRGRPLEHSQLVLLIQSGAPPQDG